MLIKKAILLLAALCAVAVVVAQDRIVKRDAVQIEAKVLEIDAQTVRYKRFSNLDGPTYLLAIAEVDYILYANGEKEQFDAPATQSVSATPAEPSTSDVPEMRLGDEYVLKQYEIGDLYDRDGVKGVVCELSDDKTHGTILSLQELYLPWSTFRKPNLCVVGADDRGDGQVNMARVARYIADNHLSWDDFPAFKWCREQGEGWYLPAIDELLVIGLNYNGNSRMQPNRKVRAKVNDTLKEQGGKRMDRLVYYFASTELDAKNVFTTHMDIQPPYVNEIPKYNKFIVRAVRRF